MSAKYRHPVNEAALSNAGLYTTRLEPDQVRLLCFDAASGTWSFQAHPLGDAPPYVTVSYTWGPNEDTTYADEIAINEDGVPRYLSAIDYGQELVNSEAEAYSLPVDGKAFRVSRNVHELATRATAGVVERLVWIDALCINQADSKERSSQVNMMASIFAQAEYVLVWLGMDDRNEAESVMDLCKAIVVEYERQVVDGGRDTGARRIPNPWDPGVLEAMGLPPAMDDRWHILARFYDRRWFNRVWIIQEIVSSSAVQIWWGATELDYLLLMNASSFILQSQFPLFARRDNTVKEHRSSEWYVIKRRIGETLAKINGFKFLAYRDPREVDGQPYMMDSYDRQSHVVGGPKFIDGELRQDCMRNWANMLETDRTFDATDPRDYIYATLGVINTAAVNRDWSKTGIVPDYTKSVAEVYADASMRIMEAGKCINLVSLAQDPQMRRQHDLPSWVPDFSARGEMPILLPRARRSRLMPTLYDMAKTLARSASPIFQVRDDLWVLNVKAIRLDKISEIGESHYNLCNNGMWENIAQILLSRKSFARDESNIESLWRTLVANTAIDGESVAGPEISTLFKSFVTISLVMNTFKNPDHLERLPTWQKLTETHRAACNHDEDVALLPSFERVGELAQEMERLKKEIEAGAEPPPKLGPNALRAGVFGGATECMYYRRILLTESGYLGFGPMSTMPGDEVWLLPGMPLPTILTKTGDGAYYKVLGESYLHGDPDFSEHYGVKDSQWIDLV